MPKSVNQYIKTSIDFWKLRPRKFHERERSDPLRYLPPYQFLWYNLSILFFLFSATLVVILTYFEDGWIMIIFSSVYMVVLVLDLIINTSLYTLLSKIWPIRGKSTFLSIFKSNCYTSSALIPPAALILIDFSIILVLNGNIDHINQTPLESSLKLFLIISIIISVPYTIIVWAVWQIPGIAVVNGVSTSRVFYGFFLWLLVLSGLTIPLEPLLP